MTKVFFLFSLITLLLASCIGETLECSESHYNVKNQLKDSILITYSSPEKGIRRDSFIIESDGKAMIFNYSYQCLDNGGKIENGTAEGGFLALKEGIDNWHLVICNVTGDTLADFSPSSSIYDRENWELSIDDKYDVDCTLILTEDLIKTARP